MSAAIAAVAVAAIGAGVAAYGASQQASAQKKAGKYAAESSGRQQAQSEYEAKLIVEQSQEKARKVRAEAIRVRGQQVATAAASGVVVGDGSSSDMLDEVTRLSEEDAVAVLWDGANGFISSTEEGRLARLDGEFKYKNSFAQANATLISGFGQALSQAGGAMSMGSSLGKGGSGGSGSGGSSKGGK